MCKYTRNPNYLGEMMIYGSFILFVNDYTSYVCVLYVWVIGFTPRIYLKELSLRQEDGWDEYSARSWLILPKINGRLLDSIIFYGVVGSLGYWTYLNGGVKENFIYIRSAFTNRS